MHIISGKYEMSELKKEQNVKYSYFLLLKNCTWSNQIPNIRKKVMHIFSKEMHILID